MVNQEKCLSVAEETLRLRLLLSRKKTKHSVVSLSSTGCRLIKYRWNAITQAYKVWLGSNNTIQSPAGQLFDRKLVLYCSFLLLLFSRAIKSENGDQPILFTCGVHELQAGIRQVRVVVVLFSLRKVQNVILQHECLLHITATGCTINVYNPSVSPSGK